MNVPVVTRSRLPKAFSDLFVPARYKGYYGGRGGAKSRSFAEAAIIQSTQEPIRFLCCREIQRSIRESVKFILDATIAARGLTRFFESTNTEIRGDNGTHFFFEGLRANATAIQSLEAIDRVWVEEANTVSQTSLDILIPTIRNPGSELWFSWNPRNAADPVDAMFRGSDAQAGDDVEIPPPYKKWAICREVNYVDNPWFPDVLRAEMERDKRRSPEKYAHIWLGKYATRSEARVFSNWKIGTIEVPKGTRPYYGADWGFSVDPTVLVRAYILPNRVLFVEAEVSAVGCEIDRTPALFDQMDNGVARKWPIRADSARPETISYMRQHGYPQISPARKGPGSVEEGVEFLKTYDIVVHPNCRHVIDELTLYSYEIDKLTNEVLPVLADKDNNTIDALRYSIEEVRRSAAIAGPIITTRPYSNFGDNQEAP